MSEYEWEAGRFPPARDPRGIVRQFHGHRAIAEYGALEYPRESVTWIANSQRALEGERPPEQAPRNGNTRKRKSVEVD